MSKIFLITTILLIVSCAEEKIQPLIDENKTQNEIPSHESWNSKITFTDEGKIKAVLFAQHLKKFEIEKITLIDGVKIDFYTPEQKVASKLTSLRGKVDDITLDMYAIDSVVAVNDSGTVLKTQELKWRNSDDKIVTDKFVSIKSPKEIIEGYGLESDQHLKNYIIFNVTYSSTVSESKKK